MRLWCVGGTPTPPVAAPGDFEPWFEDVAGAWGLTFEHVSGYDGQYLMPEIMACLPDWTEVEDGLYLVPKVIE